MRYVLGSFLFCIANERYQGCKIDSPPVICYAKAEEKTSEGRTNERGDQILAEAA